MIMRLLLVWHRVRRFIREVTLDNGVHWADGVVVFLYVAFVLGIGWYYGRRQKNADEYFVGNRAMHPVLIGISMYATLFSTITYLGVPGEYIARGPVLVLAVVGIPFTYLIVGHLLVPYYMKKRVTSAYGLLEERLGVAVRLLAAAIFVAVRLAWMAFLIYMASRAILVALGKGNEIHLLPWIILGTGSVAIIYASIGGLRAVVITDLCQFILLFGGGLLVVVSVTVSLGGFSWVPTEWQPSWEEQPFFSFDPNVRITVVGTILSAVLWWVCTAGGDQTAVQRFMATGSPEAARRSFLTNVLAGLSVTIMLMLIGFSLLGYFQANPEHLPEGQTLEMAADDLFPHYLSFALPPGIAGLILSALFAAAMSSIDSGVNSITAVVLTDFVDRLRGAPLSERQHVFLAKVMAIIIGVIVVFMSAFVIGHVPGNYVGMTQRISNLLVSPIFVLFFMAIFVPFVTGPGAFIGAVASSAAAVTVAYWVPIIQSSWWMRWFGEPEFWKEISFQWIQPCALTAGILVGVVASLADRAIRGGLVNLAARMIGSIRRADSNDGSAR